MIFTFIFTLQLTLKDNLYRIDIELIRIKRNCIVGKENMQKLLIFYMPTLMTVGSILTIRASINTLTYKSIPW